MNKEKTNIGQMQPQAMWFFTGLEVSHIFLTDSNQMGKLACGSKISWKAGGFQENINEDKPIDRQISCKKCIAWYNKNKSKKST